jgi:hypothetical protein
MMVCKHTDGAGSDPRGGVNSFLAVIPEHHIRLHITHS